MKSTSLRRKAALSHDCDPEKNVLCGHCFALLELNCGCPDHSKRRWCACKKPIRVLGLHVPVNLKVKDA